MMRPTLFATTVFAACLGTALAAEPAGQAAKQKPLRVLVLSGHGHHDEKRTTPFLKKMYEESGRFVVDVTDKPAKMDSALLAKYDAVVDNEAGPRWGPVAEKALLDFLAAGKGFVVIHGASAGCPGWAEFEDLCGESARPGSGHGEYYQYEVKVVDHQHPITKGLDHYTSNVEEIYHNKLHRPTAHVLATAYSRPDKRGTGKDEPVLIVTRHGQGRVFHNVMGNTTSAMDNPYWKALTLRGTEWAATAKVTVPLPASE
jgi:type 1 glutamine amidotransferase